MSKKLEDKIEKLEALLEQKEIEVSSFKREMSLLNDHIENLLDKLDLQIQLTQKIQEKLVPTEIPNIPGFEFSNKFVASPVSGGDYFDIFEVEDRFRFSILLSSCSGYGLSSLFLIVLLKLTAHIETKKGAAPEKFINMIYQELQSQISEKDKAHIFYGLINRRNFDLTYCHAGENRVFHFKSSTGKAEEIEPTVGPIEKLSKKKWVSKTLSLNPKDRIVLVSEGVQQVFNKNNIQFPIEKILEILESEKEKPVHSVRNEVLFQIQKWSGKKDLQKDVTVLVSEVKERVLKLAKN